jgi:hypothetical protein
MRLWEINATGQLHLSKGEVYEDKKITDWRPNQAGQKV